MAIQGRRLREQPESAGGVSWGDEDLLTSGDLRHGFGQGEQSGARLVFLYRH